jgi:hypothetical protein
MCFGSLPGLAAFAHAVPLAVEAGAGRFAPVVTARLADDRGSLGSALQLSLLAVLLAGPPWPGRRPAYQDPAVGPRSDTP